MVWLTAISSRLWGWVIAAGALAAALFVALAKAKSDGVQQQVAVQAAADREAAHVRMEEDARAGRAADPAAELRSRWGR